MNNKKTRKLFGALLLVLALVSVSVPVPRLGAADANSFYTEGKKLISYKGSDTVVTVPEGIEIIEKGAFENNQKIERVILGPDVKTINPYAFWKCNNLKEVVLDKKLQDIGDYAFANCKGLETMTVPDNVESIGIQSFEDCVNMTDIYLSYKLHNIHETSFDGCIRLVIHCEEGTYAWDYAKKFYEKQASMQEEADVNLFPIDNPDLEYVPGNPIFEGAVTDDGRTYGSVQVVGNHAVLFIDNSKFPVYDGSLVPGTSSVELAPTVLEGVIPKNSIVDNRVVADHAYYRSTDYEALTIPADIVEIGEFSFARSSLKSVDLGTTVETIGFGAFYHCEDLKEVRLPYSVVKVEPNAFARTPFLDDFLAGKTNPGSDYLISGGVLLGYRGNSSSVQLPADVRVIAAGVFANHEEISSVLFPASLVSIGEEAFAGCSHLNSVFFGGNEIQILDRAFSDTKLDTVTLPRKLQYLGIGSFDSAVTVNYEGQAPLNSFENTASRLTNYAFRGRSGNGSGSVSTKGVIGTTAKLEGAVDRYSLEILPTEDIYDLSQAFRRNLGRELPNDSFVYTMLLTDDSGIPIHKLGKQKLTVRIPITEIMEGRSYAGIMLDRNGQAEKLTIRKEEVNNKPFLAFETNTVYDFCLYPDSGVMEGRVLTEEADFVEYSAPPQESGMDWFRYGQWMAGGACLIGGLVLLLKRF